MSETPRTDAERFRALLEMDASEQDEVLRPPIPPNDLEHPERWPAIVRAAIDAAVAAKVK